MIENNCSKYLCSIKQFKGSKDDKEYKLLEEMLTRGLEDLDGIDVSGCDQARQKRKHIIDEILTALDIPSKSQVLYLLQITIFRVHTVASYSSHFVCLSVRQQFVINTKTQNIRGLFVKF